MKFRILFYRRADEFLRELKPEDKQRIVGKLKELKDFPARALTALSHFGQVNMSGA